MFQNVNVKCNRISGAIVAFLYGKLERLELSFHNEIVLNLEIVPNSDCWVDVIWKKPS